MISFDRLLKNQYLNIIPYKPTKFFSNWNREFYTNYKFKDIITLDSCLNKPVQFELTKNRIISTSKKLGRKISILILAFGTGSILDIIEQNKDLLKDYISEIVLSDLVEINLDKWHDLNDFFTLKKKIGNVLNDDFFDEFKVDFIYANELISDLPNKFIYKNNYKVYDFSVKIYTKDNLPSLIKKQVKNSLYHIYHKGFFPEIFTPTIGKLLRFDIVNSKRSKENILEDIYELYPDNSIISVSKVSVYLIERMYKCISDGGMIMINDYGFFSKVNLHIINNLFKNQEYSFIKNNYGEFTTDSSYDFLFYQLKKKNIPIKINRTASLVSKVTKTPSEIVNLDGEIRDEEFFLGLIRDRFNFWRVNETKPINDAITYYLKNLNLKNNDLLLNKTIVNINNCIDYKLSENNNSSLRKILKGYFNDDDHRFLTIEIN